MKSFVSNVWVAQKLLSVSLKDEGRVDSLSLKLYFKKLHRGIYQIALLFFVVVVQIFKSNIMSVYVRYKYYFDAGKIILFLIFSYLKSMIKQNIWVGSLSIQEPSWKVSCWYQNFNIETQSQQA